MQNKIVLDEKAQKMAIHLATNIYLCGDELDLEAYQHLWSNTPVTIAIMEYWNTCNMPQTNFALNKMLQYRGILHLENCLKLQPTGYPEIEN